MRNTVLYVDDNRDHLLVLEARLMRLGYDVLSAGSGAEALNIFASNQVDLAVVDYYMLGMNGDIVALEMKNLKPQVRIIMFSGTFSLPALVVAIVEGFVSTSYAPDALTQKIQELLYLRKAQKAS